jgi:hypothetical protein
VKSDLEGILSDAEGNRGRPLAWDRWWVPAPVDQKGNRLVWGLRDGRCTVATGELLGDFVGLTDAPDKRILGFARRWGVLGICRHGLPASHNPPPVPLPIPMPFAELPWCYPVGYWKGAPSEPLDAWRTYSKKFGAILNIAAQIQEGRGGKPGDWDTLHSPALGVPLRPSAGKTVAVDRRMLGAVLNQMLRQARVGVTLSWNDGKPVLEYTGAGLMAALALQVTLAIARTDGLAVCTACGCPYVPTRRPRRGGRRYCPPCTRRGAPQRDAAADYRRRRDKVRVRVSVR